MSSRHTRRKAAKLRDYEKLIALAQAERSRQIAAIVRDNMSKPIERNYYPSSPMGRLSERATYGRVGTNIKSLDYLPKGSVAHGFNKG
jgi:hypothetical protein